MTRDEDEGRAAKERRREGGTELGLQEMVVLRRITHIRMSMVVRTWPGGGAERREEKDREEGEK